MKFRKLPIVIDAWPARDLMAAYRQKFIGEQLGDFGDMPTEVGEAYLAGGWQFVGAHSPDREPLPDDTILVPTGWGTITATMTDWIVRGPGGGFYPVRGDQFEATYEAVD